MRKKTINCLIDGIFWGIIWLMPLICIALVAHQSGSIVNVSQAMSECGFSVLTNNFIFEALNSVFGSGGVVELFSSDILSYFTYFISISMLHIMVDVLLWLPRLMHKWMKEAQD